MKMKLESILCAVTNLDVCVWPHGYDVVEQKLRGGHSICLDALGHDIREWELCEGKVNTSTVVFKDTKERTSDKIVMKNFL